MGPKAALVAKFTSRKPDKDKILDKNSDLAHSMGKYDAKSSPQQAA
jgi:hypothetical protein